MGKKDKKKGKGIEKTSIKTDKKAKNKMKKELAAKGEEDIESLLMKFAEEDRKKIEIIEELVPPPSKRSSFSLTSHPNTDQLILFGGEFFNGTKTILYNELYFYNIKQDKWIRVVSPGGPPPRCSHQAVAVAQGGGQLWIFGGEFTSPSQSQFYHYKDLWVFHFSSKKWEKITGTGNGPSSRSGHRMIQVKKQLIVFGGFHDNLRDYKYYNDVFSFNLETLNWKNLDVSGNGPSPRSGCQMVPTSDGRILVYGGYSKEKLKKDVDRGITYSDLYMLYPDKHDTTGLKWKWQIVKPSGIKPSPRCAFAMALSTGDKAYMFGGVYDEKDDEEEIEGMFYNDLYQLDLVKTTWHQVVLSGKKKDDKKKRRRKKEDGTDDLDIEDEVHDQLETMTVEESSAEKVISDDGVFTVTVGPSSEMSASPLFASKDISSGSSINVPPPRINPGLAVKKGVLYMYGGMYEDGDKQLTLNDFHSLDLNKLEEWNTIIPMKPEDLEWFDSESDDDDDDDESEDEDAEECEDEDAEECEEMEIE